MSEGVFSGLVLGMAGWPHHEEPQIVEQICILFFFSPFAVHFQDSGCADALFFVGVLLTLIFNGCMAPSPPQSIDRISRHVGHGLKQMPCWKNECVDEARMVALQSMELAAISML